MKIHILNIHCMLNEESDKDEVFLKHQGSRIWPQNGRYHSMNSNERTPVDVIIDHDPSGDLNVELWDWDLLSSNDLIGTFQIQVKSGDYGKYTSSLRVANSKSTASYLMEWEIMED